MSMDARHKLQLRMRLYHLRCRPRLVHALDAETCRAQSVEIILEAVGEVVDGESRRVFETPGLGKWLLEPVVAHLAADHAALAVRRPGRIFCDETWMKHTEVKSASRAQRAKGPARDGGKIRGVHQRHARNREVETVVRKRAQIR